MENKMNIYEKLSHIQNELNAPKNLYNNYGNYYYRNAESILEAVKPLCLKYRATLLLEDEIEFINERYYVKAIATLMDWDSTEMIQTPSYARESESKKGMDESQITGSCSSYARKYALNGMFNIDDVKDADTNEHKQETQKNTKANTSNKEAKANTPKATAKQLEIIKAHMSLDRINNMLAHYKRTKLEELTIAEASECIGILKKEANNGTN